MSHYFRFQVLHLFFLPFLILLPGLSHGQQIPLRHIGIEEGLPSSSVYMVMEDHQGYIWFATASGVARYDGYSFKTFTVSDGLPSNDVYNLSEDKMGRIWVYTLVNALTFIEGDSVYTVPFELSDPFYLSSVAYDQEGCLWFSGHGACFRWYRRQLQFFGTQYLHDQSRAYLMRESQGIDWYVRGRNLERFDGQQYEVVHELDTSYQWILVSPNGKYLLHDLNEQYYFFHPTQHQFTKLREADLIPGRENVRLGQGTGIHRTPSSVFTTSKGNYLLDQDFKLWLPPPPIDPKVTAFAMQDRANNTWYCLEGQGVWVADAMAKWIHNYTVQEGLSHNQITALMETPSGALVLGTENGDLNVFRNGKIQGYIETPMRRRITELCLRENNRILIGSRIGIGAVRLQEDVRRTNLHWFNPVTKFVEDATYKTLGSLKKTYIDSSIKAVLPGDSGYTYLASSNNIIEEQRLPNGSFFYSVPDTAQIRAIAKGPAASIYEGTTEGLFQKSLSDFLELREFEAMRGKFITALLAIGDSVLVIGTEGSGLYLLYKDHFFPIPELRQAIIRDLSYYEVGTEIWIATNQGAWMIRPNSSNHHAYSIQMIGKQAGILSREINTIVPTDSAIYLATHAGLSVVNRQYFLQDAFPSPLLITQVRVNGKNVPSQSHYTFSHRENDLEIEYVGLSFKEKGSQRYAYRVQGIDRDYRYTHSLRVRYPQLDPGSYTFEVMLVDDQFLPVSDPETIAFTISPFWADRQEAQLGLALALLLLVAGGMWFWFDRRNKRNRIAHENAMQMTELEAKALNAQMNPHFIFNALNAMQYLMNNGEKDKANIYLASFGKLVRMNLEAADQGQISLEEELERLEYYLSLESLRLPGLISYSISIAPKLTPKRVLVPSMILQPFVENAIWHGILPADRPGKISISVLPQLKGMLKITILDDGIGIEQSRSKFRGGHNSKGIELVRRRLAFAQPEAEEAVLQIVERKSDQGTPLGTQVEILLPLS